MAHLLYNNLVSIICLPILLLNKNSHTVAYYDMNVDCTSLVISPWTFEKKSWQIHAAMVGGQVRRVIRWISTNLPVNPLRFITTTPQPVSDQLRLTLNMIWIMPNPSQRLPNEPRDFARVVLSTNAGWSAHDWKA